MGGERRRVLMMCYYFPPIHTVGANRSVGFAENLREFGWEPVVLTVKRSRIPWEATGAPVPDDLKIVRTIELNLHGVVSFCDAILNRVFRLLRWRVAPNVVRRAVCIPDAQIAWLSGLAAVRLAREADCIYVSCSPFSVAITGAIVAGLCRKPLVLDFRDPWFTTGLARRLEAWVLARTQALILNTPGALSAYARRFPRLSDRMTCIPNGYDAPAEPRPVRPRTDTFTVMHVGEFYGSRQPDTLLEAMTELGHPDMEFVQIGPVFPSLERYASRVRIRHLGVVPRTDALALMASASVLYLRVHDETEMAQMTVPGKAYEYLAAGAPILVESAAGAAADLVREYGTNPEVVTTGCKTDMAAALERAYSRRHEAPGTVNPRFLERFSRRHLTGQLAFVLDQANGPAGPGRLPGSPA